MGYKIKITHRPVVYLDMDGVVADFDTEFRAIFQTSPEAFEEEFGDMWPYVIKEAPNFFDRLEVLRDGAALKRMMSSYGVRHAFLTGVPDKWAIPQKVRWAREHFKNTYVIACESKDKALFCNPGDVLIDDRTKWRHLWEDAGGHFIHWTGDEQVVFDRLVELSIIKPFDDGTFSLISPVG